jgi:large repetitive protein
VVVSATQITVHTPAHAQGSVNVVVRNPDGQSATQTAGFTFKAPAPTLTAVSPSSGPISGGTAVTMTGTNFASGAMVTFGGAAATSVVVVSPTQITAHTPAHAQGSVNVVVTNPDGQSATRTGGFTFKAPAPTLTAVSPSSGPINGGTVVTMTGTNFASGATVTFGGAAATSVVVVSATQITVHTPAHAQGSVNVVVTNPDGQSATRTGGFTFGAPAPILTGVSPRTGRTRGGTSVTLTGRNFASGATVTFGGAAATSVVVVSTTHITAKSPPHKAGRVAIVVSNADGQRGTLSKSFTYHKH